MLTSLALGCVLVAEGRRITGTFTSKYGMEVRRVVRWRKKSQVKEWCRVCDRYFYTTFPWMEVHWRLHWTRVDFQLFIGESEPYKDSHSSSEEVKT